MNRKNEAGASDNSIDFLYFSHPACTIRKSIDYLTLSVAIRQIIHKDFIDQAVINDERFFHAFLISNGYKRTKHVKLDEKEIYEFVDIYFRSSDNNSVEIKYRPKSYYLPLLLIKIHDPDIGIINLFHSVLQENHIPFKLNDLELRFDFYADNTIKMREFLKQHLFLRYQRSPSSSKKSTYYLNENRIDSKGMKIYSRPEWNFAKMELRLRKPMLKKLNITFPLQTIDDLDLSRFFSFMNLDAEKLYQHLRWCNRAQYKMLVKRKRSFTDLLDQTIRSRLNAVLIDDHGDSAYLMNGVEAIKAKSNGIRNYSRFLKSMSDFNSKFFREVSEQKFLS